MSQPHSRTQHKYQPHLGFIGTRPVEVSNFLYSLKGHSAYEHTQKLAKLLESLSPEEQYRRSKDLTQFIRRRGLTFAKKLKSGRYKEFSVPVTTTPVVLPKSLFNQVEMAGQVFVFSLRKVLQSLYGSRTLAQSEFVQFLPSDLREIFVKTIEHSPQYLKQLHHEVMKDYPFFDAVGLDLVMTRDLLSGEGLPFEILEINAGSPSGAANNTHVLTGLFQVFPELKTALDRVMPNDHFETLAQTYQSLGQSWTQTENGVSIILPPGGGNGATPEIHQLAALSGLIYCDPTQLYRAPDGHIYLRTLSGNDPIVTSVYSRVNADSALFDLKRGISMRDQESGETLYVEDTLQKKNTEGKHPPLKDALNRPIPMMSQYALPEAIDAIHSRKLYLGGLNRILDNKILLPILADHAPRFAKKDLELVGLTPELARLRPPPTLTPGVEALEQVKKNPEDWVIKAPDLSGGSGVHILKCLTTQEQKDVIDEVSESPDTYTYQKLVNLGRIPVALRDHHGSRLANLAADVRMWMFFGDGPNFKKPKLTHNGLVRVAPEEKGPNSSIVNTSKGGGYSSLIIADDTMNPQAVHVSELLEAKEAIPLSISIPIFVGAQMVQIKRILERLDDILESNNGDSLLDVSHLVVSLQKQTNEVLSFLHPQNIEPVSRMMELLEKLYKESGRTSKDDPLLQRALAMDAIQECRAYLEPLFFDASTTEAQLRSVERSLKRKVQGSTLKLRKLHRVLRELHRIENLESRISKSDRFKLKAEISAYRSLYRARLRAHKEPAWADLMETPIKREFLAYHSIFPNSHVPQALSNVPIASQFEFLTDIRVTESDGVLPRLRQARTAWVNKSRDLNLIQDSAYRHQEIEKLRTQHLERFPELKRYQALLDSRDLNFEELIDLIEITPYAHFNLIKFAALRGTTPLQSLSHDLVPGKICFLTVEQRKSLGLYSPSTAGECFAKRRSPNSLFSESEIFIWVADELSPLEKLITLGHELTHYHQILEVIELEKKTRGDGPVAFAQFLNFFGNFLGSSTLTQDPNQPLSRMARQPFYGLADAAYLESKVPFIRKALKALRKDDQSFETLLRDYGSILSFLSPAANPTLVKAIREVIPALENARNIRFVTELGLKTPLDAIASMLPTSNESDRKRLAHDLEKLIKEPRLSNLALKRVANHQLIGVRLSEFEFKLPPHYSPIYMGMSYNSVQQ